jgi:predicted small integral membrane protein
MSNTDHASYEFSFLPAVTSPILIWAALILVVGLEFAAGLLAAKGAADMWSARNASPEVFNEAKKYALYGSGVGVVVWLGFFGVAGGAVFQMWQTEIGSNSMNGAFQLFASCAFVFVIVSMAND